MPKTSGPIYGYYQTATGRDYLRAVYRRWLDRNRTAPGASQFNDTKMASIVAVPSPSDQRREDRLTRAALRRWASNTSTQLDLWRDTDKTERVLAKLEQQLMLEPEFAEILADRAADQTKLEVGEALAKMLVGHGRDSGFPLRVLTNLESMEGLFSVHHIIGGEIEESDPHDGGMTFWKTERHHHFPLLAFQEARLSVIAGQATLQRRKAGFLFVGEAAGSFIRFAISHHNPKMRWAETYNRVSEHYFDASYDDAEDEYDSYLNSMLYRSSYSAFSTYAPSEFATQIEEEIYYIQMGIYLRKEKDNQYFEISDNLSCNIWNIPI